MKNLFLTLFALITFTSLNAQGKGGPYSTDENTVLLLHFDGDLANSSTLSADAVAHGDNMSYNPDAVAGLGQSLRIDNENPSNKNYISVPHDNNLNLTGNWTIEAWIKISSFNANTQSVIVRKPGDSESYSSNYTLELQPWWGNILHGFYFSNPETRINVTELSPTLNQWYHVAFIRDVANSKISFMVHNENWELVSSSSKNYSGTNVLLNSQELRIGENFNGYIDELRISNVVRDFSYTLDKPQIKSENLTVYYDEENVTRANTIITQLQNKTDFYKKYFKHFFLDHTKIFSINICKDISEFNQFKPAVLPDFETAYVHNEILYIIAPATAAQQGYFDSFEQAAMHGFTMKFLDDEYKNTAAEWMRYGFARHQSGMKPDVEEIRTEVANLGRKPTMQEMNNWEQITAFNKYNFAYTIFQYVADVHSFNSIFNQIRFSNNSVQYGFRNFNTEEKFEETWHYSLDLFYLRDAKRMELQRETENYRFYLVDEDLAELDEWATQLEEFYTRFTNDMEMTIEHKINVFFYPDICDFHHIQGNDDCPVGSCGEALGIDLAKFARVYDGNPMLNSISLAKHEITHVIHINLEFWRNPAWLLEGLACLVPGGLISEDIINGSTEIIKEQVNVGFSEVVAAAGRYPVIDDFESGSFVEQYSNANNMYYLLGSIVVDYLLKTSGYLKMKAFILTDAKDYTTLGFADKVDFMDSFYSFYEENWKNPPQNASAKNVQTAVTVDGDFNEPDWNLNQDIEEIYPFYQKWSNNSSRYGALWDNNYLYVAIEVTDNELVDNSSAGWRDGVRVFVDADLNKGCQYDSFDRQFTKFWNDSGLTEANNHISGVLHAVKNTSNGYNVELAIPWDNLGVTPEIDKTIGFDVSNLDNVGNYAYQMVWSGNNLNDGTTINFGELTLLSAFNAAPTVSGIPDQTINRGENFTIINLCDYVTDADHNDSELTWVATGGTELIASIDNNGMATITTPNSGWTGNETITFTATDPMGASGNASVTFISQAGTNISDLYSDSRFIIYPNPAHRVVYTQFPETIDLSIVSITGEKVLEMQNARNVAINVSEFKKGIYIVVLKGKRGIITKKLIVD